MRLPGFALRPGLGPAGGSDHWVKRWFVSKRQNPQEPAFLQMALTGGKAATGAANRRQYTQGAHARTRQWCES